VLRKNATKISGLPGFTILHHSCSSLQIFQACGLPENDPLQPDHSVNSAETRGRIAMAERGRQATSPASFRFLPQNHTAPALLLDYIIFDRISSHPIPRTAHAPTLGFSGLLQSATIRISDVHRRGNRSAILFALGLFSPLFRSRHV